MSQTDGTSTDEQQVFLEKLKQDKIPISAAADESGIYYLSGYGGMGTTFWIELKPESINSQLPLIQRFLKRRSIVLDPGAWFLLPEHP